MRIRGYLMGCLTLLVLLGCGTSQTVKNSTASLEEVTVLSLYEQRLIRLLEAKDGFDQWASTEGRENPLEVQRRFRSLAGSFQSLVADNPKELDVRLIYGKFLDFYGDTQGAFEQFIKALEIDSEVAVAHQQLGTLYAERGDFARALAYYLRATELEPNEAAYHYGLGELLFAFRPGFIKQGVFSGNAIDTATHEAFEQAAKLAPDNTLYQFRLGESYYEFDDPDWQAAFDYWERLKLRADLNDFQQESIRLEQAHCLGELGDFEKALILAEKETTSSLEENRLALIDVLKAALERSNH